MGYTVCGFELMRLTAVTWPEGDALIDVLVRPQGAILDFNTRFSGISPEAWNSAIPYNGTPNTLDSLLPPPPPGSELSSPAVNSTGPMPIVDSPAAARDLLCSYITPSTPLLGHALENDLNVVRLCHPRIIDTVVLFPHPRGLPIRYGLKMLTKTRLNRDIQMGGANGHDSLEDARATGELVRYAVKRRWVEMKREGWKLEDGRLMPPLPADIPPLPQGEEEKVLGGSAGVKRQRIQIPGGENGEAGLAKRQKL
jgi:DNA polymerase III epsilon subunit-like protein